VTHQRSIYALPIGIELLLIYNFTANEDDIGRHAGTSLIKGGWNEQTQSVSWLTFTDRRDSTFHEHAEIFVSLSIFTGLDICITVEPLDRLLQWREFSQHNSLDALILIRVEHLEWSVPCEHIDVLGVPSDLPVALEPRSVLHRLADINKIVRHNIHLLTSLAPRSASL
jgi:hypothetical protein